MFVSLPSVTVLSLNWRCTQVQHWTALAQLAKTLRWVKYTVGGSTITDYAVTKERALCTAWKNKWSCVPWKKGL